MLFTQVFLLRSWAAHKEDMPCAQEEGQPELTSPQSGRRSQQVDSFGKDKERQLRNGFQVYQME